MKLYDILSILNGYDEISIHSTSGNVVYSGLFSELKPFYKTLIGGILNDEVGQVRPYNNTLVVLMK